MIKKPENIGKILVIQLRAIGDVVQTTAVLPVLRKHFPDSKIHFLTTSATGSLLENVAELNKVLVYPYKSYSLFGLIRFILKVRKEKYDLVIDYQISPATALFTLFSGAEYRIGPTMSRRQWAYNLISNANLQEEYIAIQRCRFLERLGIEDINLRTRIGISGTDGAVVDDYFKNAEIDRRKLLVNMTPRGRRQARQWYAEKFARLADMLIEKYDAVVFYNWGPGEKDYVEWVASLSKQEVRVLPGWRLSEFAAFLSRVDLHFSYDNGPKHIATALGTPTLALFAATRPEVWNLPDDPNHPFIVSTVPCRYCNLRRCDLMICMKQIEPDDFLQKIEKIPELQEKLQKTRHQTAKSF